jgi:hypothetical protein
VPPKLLQPLFDQLVAPSRGAGVGVHSEPRADLVEGFLELSGRECLDAGGSRPLGEHETGRGEGRGEVDDGPTAERRSGDYPHSEVGGGKRHPVEVHAPRGLRFDVAEVRLGVVAAFFDDDHVEARHG